MIVTQKDITSLYDNLKEKKILLNKIKDKIYSDIESGKYFFSKLKVKGLDKDGKYLEARIEGSESKGYSINLLDFYEVTDWGNPTDFDKKKHLRNITIELAGGTDALRERPLKLPDEGPLWTSNFSSLFLNLTNVTVDLSGWDVSNVTDMGYMFSRAANFNLDLSNWDVSNIKTKPTYFDTNAGFANNALKQPQWGTCPPRS